MLRGRACKARFFERKGTPLFDTRLPPEKVESVLEHIAERGAASVRPGGFARYIAAPSAARAEWPGITRVTYKIMSRSMPRAG